MGISSKRRSSCGEKSHLHNPTTLTTFLPPGFLTKKHAKMGTFLNIFFPLFSTKNFPLLMISRKKPFPSNSTHKWGHPQSSECTKKEESPCNLIMEKPSWVWLTMCVSVLPLWLFYWSSYCLMISKNQYWKCLLSVVQTPAISNYHFQNSLQGWIYKQWLPTLLNTSLIYYQKKQPLLVEIHGYDTFGVS